MYSTRARLLDSLRRANGCRALVLLLAMMAGALGVALLAVAVCLVETGTL